MQDMPFIDGAGDSTGNNSEIKLPSQKEALLKPYTQPAPKAEILPVRLQTPKEVDANQRKQDANSKNGKRGKRKPCAVATHGHAQVPVYKSFNRGKVNYQVPHFPFGNKKRRLKSFRDFDEAYAFADALAKGKEEQKFVVAKITPEELEAACLVATILMPFVKEINVPLKEAIEEYRKAKSMAGSRDLVQIVKEYLLQPWVTKQVTPLTAVIDAFLAAKKQKGCRYETLKTLSATLGAWARRIGDKKLVEVTSEDINTEVHVPTRKSRSNKTYYCSLHNLFTWAKRNGYLRPEVPSAMDAVECPIVDHSRPEIVEVELARTILTILAEKGDPFHVLYVVLSLFSGIRSDESTLLHWKHVTPSEQIVVPADISKTHHERPMPILPNLDAWLKPFYGRKGCIFPARTIQVKVSLLLKEHNVFWKRNWLRHSYASYRLAFTDSLMSTSDECGNSPAVLERDYLKRVTKLLAQAYVSLTPESCGIKDWDKMVKEFLASIPECHEHRTRKSPKKAEITQAEAGNNPD